jgi:RND family efflux transporter MFP subunit
MSMRVAPLASGIVALVAAVTVLVASLRGVRAAPERGQGAAGSATSRPDAPSVTTATQASAAAPTRDFVGVFMAREATEVAALLPGRLASVSFRIGDRVHAGDVVATLDTRAQDLDLAVARAQAAEARAEMDIAASQADTAVDQYARTHSLAAAGLASGADQAAATGARRVAELRAVSARVTLARQHATVGRLTRDRDETLVRAPFDGFVVARYVDPGANVTPDRAILRIVRSGEMMVRFALPEERAGQIAIGTPVRAVTPGAGVEVAAVVRRISPEVDAATRWFVVEADVDGSAAETLVGAAADVFLAAPAGASP